MEVDNVTIINVPISPTFPTTQPKRKYIITPNIVNIDGVNTPPKVFKIPFELVVEFLIIFALIFNYDKLVFFKMITKEFYELLEVALTLFKSESQAWLFKSNMPVCNLKPKIVISSI